ncbi:MAG: DEAD/DEAH box helicase [Micrococcales bacterium 73-13]|nr:MAG: DEAD/DEAH box helicase [Micrococcales bacterium 73-13]
MTTLHPTFSELGVPAALVEVLARAGKTTAFPIQADTLPDTLAGRDVLGRGRTGSGKTLAFGIPMVARLASGTRRAGRPLGLVLAPTRELATQIDAVIAPLAAACGLTTTTIFGGVSQVRQVAALRAGVDIVVACPGRLEDLMQQGHLRLDAIEITVLDEADHMADLGFLPGVTRIMSATPETGQRMLFSATLDNGVDKLVRRFLHDPRQHEVDEIDAPPVAMTHHAFVVDAAAKRELVHALASGVGRRILFLRTKHTAKRLARELTAAGIPAVDLHGNLSQGQRDRNLAAFADGAVRVLVATDVAARGVHVDDVELVVHVDPPTEHKAYLHRSGRTARAGAAGDVVTLVTPEQERDVAGMMRRAGIRVQSQRVTAAAAPVRELVGEVAPRVAPPAPAQPAPRRSAPRDAPRGSAQGAGAASPRGGRRSRRGGSGGRSRSGGQVWSTSSR